MSNAQCKMKVGLRLREPPAGAAFGSREPLTLPRRESEIQSNGVNKHRAFFFEHLRFGFRYCLGFRY